jgi:hypothetical protein
MKLFKTRGGVKIKSIADYFLPIAAVGILFFLVRTLNLALFSSIDEDDLTHLVYLPAGIRLLAVAIYGRLGILGILFGWFLCYFFEDNKTLLESLCLGLISGLTAYLALQIWQKIFQIKDNLNGLTSRLAIFLVLISAVFSAFIRYLYLYSIDPLTPFGAVFLVGLTGDILGAFIVLYFIKLMIYLRKYAQSR